MFAWGYDHVEGEGEMNVTLEVSRYHEDEVRLALTSQTRVMEELERKLLEYLQILRVLRRINNLSDGWEG
jgi:hypothetical protein